jgi:molybdopterin-biosynthesis enzyme MoeA-like protein
MAKKQTQPEKADKTEETPLSSEVIANAGENISDLAKKLSEVATKMQSRNIPSIESKGWKNLNLAIEKLGGAIGSVERAYRKASVEPVKSKVTEKRESQNNKQ